jgi:hypothetical protein
LLPLEDPSLTDDLRNDRGKTGFLTRRRHLNQLARNAEALDIGRSTLALALRIDPEFFGLVAVGAVAAIRCPRDVVKRARMSSVRRAAETSTWPGSRCTSTSIASGNTTVSASNEPLYLALRTLCRRLSLLDGESGTAKNDGMPPKARRCIINYELRSERGQRADRKSGLERQGSRPPSFGARN